MDTFVGNHGILYLPNSSKASNLIPCTKQGHSNEEKIICNSCMYAIISYIVIAGISSTAKPILSGSMLSGQPPLNGHLISDSQKLPPVFVVNLTYIELCISTVLKRSPSSIKITVQWFDRMNKDSTS